MTVRILGIDPGSQRTGVGIIDVGAVFGIGRVRKRKAIGLVVELEEWATGADYDRTGLIEEHVDILGVRIPYLRKSRRTPCPLCVANAGLDQPSQGFT